MRFFDSLRGQYFSYKPANDRRAVGQKWCSRIVEYRVPASNSYWSKMHYNDR